MSQEKIEKNVGLLIVCTLLAVIWGGLVEIVPLFFQKSTTTAAEGVKPYSAVQLAGRDVYIREGCYNCHSQMIRPFRAETERYGHYSVAGEFVFDHPFQWSSKRTGPDLHRVGNRYSDEWHRMHLRNPRAAEPDSNMPAYVWLQGVQAKDSVGMNIEAKMQALALVGVPYEQKEIEEARKALGDLTEEDVLIAYLQGLGTTLTTFK
jgi:cytochrome c oxidase cbb3-type subunit 2